jgi:hypothetical protein
MQSDMIDLTRCPEEETRKDSIGVSRSTIIPKRISRPSFRGQRIQTTRKPSHTLLSGAKLERVERLICKAMSNLVADCGYELSNHLSAIAAITSDVGDQQSRLGTIAVKTAIISKGGRWVVTVRVDGRIWRTYERDLCPEARNCRLQMNSSVRGASTTAHSADMSTLGGSQDSEQPWEFTFYGDQPALVRQDSAETLLSDWGSASGSAATATYSGSMDTEENPWQLLTTSEVDANTTRCCGCWIYTNCECQSRVDQLLGSPTRSSLPVTQLHVSGIETSITHPSIDDLRRSFEWENPMTNGTYDSIFSEMSFD